MGPIVQCPVYCSNIRDCSTALVGLGYTHSEGLTYRRNARIGVLWGLARPWLFLSLSVFLKRSIMALMAGVKPLKDILAEMSASDTDGRTLVAKAYTFAEDAHKDQKRYSGEPYFVHLAEVGYSLAKIGMDAPTIAAGILHDSIEDVGVSPETMETEFGKEILMLVDGVTKLGALRYRGVERHTESLRKLFAATAHDIRVLIIKLMDRLHNAKTLEHVPAQKRKRIALETLEIYAPIADRLGMSVVKTDLEDAAFPYAYPAEYERVKALL
jgi:(p)ppGpp synthase/HD superfamily hydrolase